MRQLPPIVAAVGTATAGVLPVFLTGALAVQIRHDLGFGRVAQGVVIATFFAAAACFSILFGRLADRRGPARVLRVATLVSAASLLGVAVGAGSVGWLVVALVVAGIANGAIQPAANLLVARAIRPDRQGLAFGIKQAAIPMATLLASLAVPTLALTVGWRYAFGSAAILATALTVVIPDPPVVARGSVPSTERIDLAPLVLLTAAFGLGAGAANALGAFLVTTSVATGMHPGTAGLLAALASATGLTVRITAGRLADRRGARHLPVVAGMLAAGTAGYLLLALADLTRLTWLLVPAALLAYGAGWGWNGLFNFAIVRVHPWAPARATGVTQSGAYLGSVAGPLLFGLVSANAGDGVAWLATAVVAAVAAAGMVGGRRLLVHRRPELVDPPVSPGLVDRSPVS